MVTPVNSDKPITTDTNISTQSNRRISTEQSGEPKSNPESQTTAPTQSELDVENARQLYQLENRAAETIGSSIETPEQARMLLNQILQQFNTNPEQGHQLHSGVSNHLLTSLLEQAPA